jgi:hypothetical protein
MPTNETGLTGAIVRAIKKRHPGCWVVKIAGGPYQESGIPDLLVCVRGLLVGIEVKFQRPGESQDHALGRTTPGQHVQIMRINRAGGSAATVTSVKDALALIEYGLAQREKELHESRNH